MTAVTDAEAKIRDMDAACKAYDGDCEVQMGALTEAWAASEDRMFAAPSSNAADVATKLSAWLNELENLGTASRLAEHMNGILADLETADRRCRFDGRHVMAALRERMQA